MGFSVDRLRWGLFRNSQWLKEKGSTPLAGLLPLLRLMDWREGWLLQVGGIFSPGRSSKFCPQNRAPDFSALVSRKGDQLVAFSIKYYVPGIHEAWARNGEDWARRTWVVGEWQTTFQARLAGFRALESLPECHTECPLLRDNP